MLTFIPGSFTSNFGTSILGPLTLIPGIIPDNSLFFPFMLTFGAFKLTSIPGIVPENSLSVFIVGPLIFIFPDGNSILGLL